jgi:hypothetical protein
MTGKLRALAVTTATRWDGAPDIPTVDEFVPGYEASVWLGAPKTTPVAIIDKLNTEINAVVGAAGTIPDAVRVAGKHDVVDEHRPVVARATVDDAMADRWSSPPAPLWLSGSATRTWTAPVPAVAPEG